MPAQRCHFGQVTSRLAISFIKETKLNALSDTGEQRKIYAMTIVCGAKRIWGANAGYHTVLLCRSETLYECPAKTSRQATQFPAFSRVCCVANGPFDGVLLEGGETAFLGEGNFALPVGEYQQRTAIGWPSRYLFNNWGSAQGQASPPL